METVSKLEVRYRDRDTKFVDELVAERTRLITENSQLTRRNQQLEELQVGLSISVDLTAFDFF